MTDTHKPLMGALWMVVAGISFAAINSLTQILSINMGVSSPIIALYQYALALFLFIPWLMRNGLVDCLKTHSVKHHVIRVLLAVIGIQLWIAALAYPIPIWQGTALLMTSPLMATLGAGFILKESLGWIRILASCTGFSGALLILEPWSDQFDIALFLPLGAAFCWAGYSLMLKKISSEDSSKTIVIYLLILITPMNLLLAMPYFEIPVTYNEWSVLSILAVLTAFAHWAIANAYSCSDAAFLQPWDHFKLPINVLFGYLLFGWIPPGSLWVGALIIVAAISFITHFETKASFESYCKN